MNPFDEFQREVRANIAGLASDEQAQELTKSWFRRTLRHRYSYNFTWLGRPIIQYPQDLVALQEVIWSVRPDLIIECGIAHGGSLVMSASMLTLLDYCDAVSGAAPLDWRTPRRRVLGVDIEIRAHNRSAIESHPLANRIDMLQGSSTDRRIVEQVRRTAADHERVLVVLDSNHTHEHVLAELESYAPLVSKGSYCVVFDTVIEDLPEDSFPNRPWGKGCNPKTAVHSYLGLLATPGRTAVDGEPLKFEIDRMLEQKLLITVAPDGYLRRIS